MPKYFENCKTLEDLKKEFRRLALLHHPDVGGDTATMQEINAEFDRVFPSYKLRANVSGNENHETAESVRSEFYTANGWKGSNYESGRSLKEIAAIVRRYVKDKYPRYKFSVRTKYASMCQELHVDLLESPVEVFKTAEHLTADDRDFVIRRANRCNEWRLTSWNDAEALAEIVRIWNDCGAWFKVLTDELRAVAADVDDFVNSYNREDCDGMQDYFDVNFYYFGCLQNNGRGVKFVPREARPRPAQNSDPETPAAVRVAFCPEHDGVEVYFSGKPSSIVRDALKADGWKWHGVKKCWFNRNTEQHLQALRSATEGAALTA